MVVQNNKSGISLQKDYTMIQHLMISKDNNAVVQSQIAVTAYIPSKQLMSSGFVEQN